MTSGSLVARCRQGWAALTFEQWRRIDAQFPAAGATHHAQARVRSTLLVVVVVLIALRYVGRTEAVLSVEPLRAWFATLPYPELWPKLYWAGWRVLGYLLVPAWMIRVLWRERLRDYGLRIDTSPPVLALYAGLFLLVLPLVFAAAQTDAFLHKYPLYKHAGGSWFELWTWEIAYALQFLALEFFFRGFALFSLARRFGANAIFLMMVPYVMIHFTKPLAETLGAVVAGLALGTLALRTGSIFGGVLVHTAVAWSMDLLALQRQGALQRLLES